MTGRKVGGGNSSKSQRADRPCKGKAVPGQSQEMLPSLM